jgi:predicted O-methyltransferase YrrM
MFNADFYHAHPPSHRHAIGHRLHFSIQRQVIAIMQQCEGWCSEHKAEILVSLVFKTKPQIIVEIGVYGGKSLLPMAYALKINQKGVIYGIDPWDHVESVKGLQQVEHVTFWEYLNHQKIKQQLIENIYNFSLHSQVVLIQSTSEAAAPINDIDLLHIDGNHSDALSYLDVTKWVPLVKRGGYIILDDMNWCDDGNYTTTHACEWLNANCTKVSEFTDDCKWGIWMKP